MAKMLKELTVEFGSNMFCCIFFEIFNLKIMNSACSKYLLIIVLPKSHPHFKVCKGLWISETEVMRILNFVIALF